jgi:hypothetical protein
MLPALAACVRHKASTVLATMWGDDGNETDFFLALGEMPLFSEACWQGEIDPQTVDAMGAFLTGLPSVAYHAFGKFYPGADDIRSGKSLIYCDLLYPLVEGRIPLEKSIADFAEARETLAAHLDREDCRYADQLFDIALEKGALVRDLRGKYIAGDKAYLREVAEVTIPRLLAKYECLRQLHRAQWEASYKRNGWEVFALRYGAVMGRLRDAAETLLRYADGALPTIAELDETPLNATRRAGMQWYNVYVDPKF